MKKTLLSLAVALICVGSTYAQTEQGKIIAGGSIGLNFRNSTTEVDGVKINVGEGKHFDIDFEPKAGYFIMDDLAVGLGIDVSIETDKYESSKDTYNSILIAPFCRYYSSIGLFGEASIGLGSSKFKEEAEDDITELDKYKFFGWSLGVGYAIFLNDNVSIEPIVSYKRSTETVVEDSSIKYKDGELMIEVGFNIYLPVSAFKK